jgi:hypothetical protein
MSEEIGILAGAIWRALDASGGMTLAQLKKEVKGKPFLFERMRDWLAGARRQYCDSTGQKNLSRPAQERTSTNGERGVDRGRLDRSNPDAGEAFAIRAGKSIDVFKNPGEPI